LFIFSVLIIVVAFTRVLIYLNPNYQRHLTNVHSGYPMELEEPLWPQPWMSCSL
jgi:hypothetical protein